MSNTLTSAFHLHLNEKIQRGQATVGKYDGAHPALTCATVAGKIFMHNPHQHGLSNNQITYLNINKQITAVVAARLNPAIARDVLLVGTQSNLQCYDVEHNKDFFFKDVGDGVNTVVVGPFSQFDQPLAIVGGNCSIQGFDAIGSERFWTVTGDNVSAMAFCDVDGDGKQELLVGSDDFDIRIFQNEEVVAEVSEADQIMGLSCIYYSRYGYALVNGTIGVYDRLDRIWRVKSKHSVCSIIAHDLDGDGIPELISGWSNGRMEVRREDSGEVVFRDHLSCSVASMVVADYRNDGLMQVIVCGVEGEVRGYMPSDPTQATAEIDFCAQVQAIADLTQRKQELMYELTSYTNSQSARPVQDVSSLIDPDTRVDSFIAINRDTATCDLVLKTNNTSVIRGVVVFGEQIFEEESLFLYPKVPNSETAVPLKPTKDVNVVLMIKVLVSTPAASSFHIFELEIELPKFAMYAAVEKGTHPDPESSVCFTVNERIPRLANWIETRFNVKATASRADALEAYFVCLRDKMPLALTVQPANNTVQVTIRTDNMDMAGEIVTDLAAYLGIVDLTSKADFPKAFEEFKGVLAKVEEYNATRLKLNADMADSSVMVKQLLIKAEDVRILGDMKAMRKYYRQLYDLNKDLISEHDKRATNHTELLGHLKEVNMMIQRAARLRVGGPKTRVVSACRAAIKANNMQVLFKIMRDGDGPV